MGGRVDASRWAGLGGVVRRGGRWRVVAVGLVVVLAVGVSALVSSAGVGTQVSCVEAGVSVVVAREVASACGHRVEVLDRRSETGQVFANPSGTLTVETTLKPARVRRVDGSWVATDATLRRDADGMVSPVAATRSIVFSGGGRGPVARIVDGARELAVGLVGVDVLPSPTLMGASAVYPEVYPGVDLRLTADVDGFSEVLVVRTRAAAANPAVRRLRFATATKGLTLRVDPVSGGVAAVDEVGGVVFGGSTPMMWDSGAAAVGGAGAGTSLAGDGEDRGLPRQRPMRVEVGAGELSVLPDVALLDDPATTFPVMLDPTWGGQKNHWTMQWKENGTTSYWDRSCVNCFPEEDRLQEAQSGLVRVGFQNFNDPVSTVRSLFEMDTTAVRGKQVLSATFSITQSWTGKACGGATSATSLYWLAGISSAVTWNNPAGVSWGTKLSTNNQVRRFNGTGTCAQQRVEWSAFTAAQAAANANASSIALGLAADNEGDQYAWRRYQLDPVLSIEYNSFPAMPDDLRVATTPQEPGFGCATGSARPYVRTLTPTLKAHVFDADGDFMQVWSAWAKLNPSTGTFTDVAGTHVDSVPSNSVVSMAASGLVDGGVYAWRAVVNDGRVAGAQTALPGCEFQVDVTPPNAPQAVTSAAYPADGSFHGSVGRTGVFHIVAAATNSADVDRYMYALTPFTTPPTDGTRTVAASPTDRSADLLLTPTVSGLNVLRVWALDRAGNPSALSSPLVYQFRVDDAAGPVGSWAADEPVGSASLADGTGNGHDLTVSGVTLGAAGRMLDRGTAATFNGVSSQAVAADAVIDTSGSFSASAWVRLTDTGSSRTAVSVDGVHGSAFRLGYSAACVCWVMVVPSADTVGSAEVRLSGPAPSVNVWTSLTGSYDPGTGQAALYVNGQPAASAAVAPLWRASGALSVGRGKRNDAAAEFWAGQVAEVRVWDRVVYPAEVAAAAGTLTGSWSLDGGGFDDLGLHDAIGGAGVGWGTDRFGVPGSAGVFDAIVHTFATAGPVLRTDQSFAVSAWMTKAPGNGGFAVAQAGDRASAFRLGYNASTDRWVFRLTTSDVDNAPIVDVPSTGAPVTGRWTHLVAVYDATTHQASLYVDGQLQATRSVTVWAASGPLTIGYAKVNGNPTYAWWGSIDSIQVYQGAVPPAAL